MRRTLFLIVAFLFSLTLVTMAYSQTSVKQALSSAVTNSAGNNCPVGSQLAASTKSKSNPDVNVIDKCGRYSAYIQGACGCDPKTGNLKSLNNSVCAEALGKP